MVANSNARAGDDSTSAFLAARPGLVRVAYRMLGSVSDAEDVVQDAWLRWQRTDRTDVVAPEGFLVTTVTRLAIDRLRAGSAERDAYPGPWLPAPLVEEEEALRTDVLAALDESLSIAMLLLLERLSPVERAVFVLREAFDFTHAEIAAVLEAEEATCRQWLRRAHDRIGRERRRFDPDPEAQRALLSGFLQAARDGDLDALRAVLTEDVRLHADGGGRVSAAIAVVTGRDRIARVTAHLAAGLPADRVSIRPVRVNGGWGVVLETPDGPHSVITASIRSGRIAELYIVRNPDKLRHLRTGSAAPLSEAAASVDDRSRARD